MLERVIFQAMNRMYLFDPQFQKDIFAISLLFLLLSLVFQYWWFVGIFGFLVVVDLVGRLLRKGKK